MRPGSPKPAFLISDWHHGSLDRFRDRQVAAGTGGYRLIVHLHHRENREHLRASLLARLARAGGSSRTILVATLSDYLSRSGRVHCFRVNKDLTYNASERLDTLILYSTDPIASDTPNYQPMTRDSVPERAIWLLSVDNADGGSPLCEHPSDAEEEGRGHSVDGNWFRRCWGNVRSSGRERRRLGDQPRRLRLLRRALPIVVALAALLPGGFLPVDNFDPDAPPPSFAMYAIFVALVWLAMTAYMANAAWYYTFVELPAPRRWEATTARCVSDGDRARNGLWANIAPRDKQRMHSDPRP